MDPVYFIQNNLTLEGTPFRLEGNGYKPFADIYRYIGLKAIEPDAKPVVLVKGRQVGATTMAAALECYFVACGLFGTHGRPPMRMLHLFPTLTMAASYTKEKLDPVISAAKPMPGMVKSNGMLKSFIEAKLDTSSPANNNMHFKKFIYGNQISIESTGLDGDRIRGRSTECAFFDEIQDVPDVAIGAVTKVLAQSKYGPPSQGVQVYFGTPKSKGGSYWKMWQSSSQQYYHLRCEGCGELFPLYRPDVNWEEIWLYEFIVKCTECGHEQNKVKAAENGKWISMNPDDDSKITFIGFHINQLYIPTFTKEAIIKAKPENSPTNTERIFMNEVLGEFFDGEGGTISIEEIHEKCADRGDPSKNIPPRRMAKQILPQDGKRVYAGFDWGQRSALEQIAGRGQGTSYSCGVVLTAEGANLFGVQFCTRLTKNNMADKEEVVEEMFRRYGVSLAVGDIGDAFDLTHNLQRTWEDRFLASRASARVNGRVRFDSDIFPKTIIFERDYYISELIGLLKNGNIKFPYGSYERIEWLIRHCCSMDIKVTKDRKGDPVKHYVKGSGPNDGFMALLNAYLAWKFDVTQGFTIRQPQQMRYDVPFQKDGIPAVLGYCPRL